MENSLELTDRNSINPLFQKKIDEKVELYSKRYFSGKDMWTGDCLWCKKNECNCENQKSN